MWEFFLQQIDNAVWNTFTEGVIPVVFCCTEAKGQLKDDHVTTSNIPIGK